MISLSFLINAITAVAQEPATPPALRAQDLDLRKVWFLPAPAKDADPICGALTAEVRQQFRSATSWSQYVANGLGESFGMTPVGRDVAANAALVDGLRRSLEDANQLILEAPGQQRLFLYFMTLGGAQRLSVATQIGPVVPSEATAQTVTPPAESWTLYRAANDSWYAVGVVADHLQVYALNATPGWRLSCDVALAPYRLRSSNDPAVKEALQAVDALELAVHAMARSSEQCGSTDDRPSEAVHSSLEAALYRPWQLAPSQASEGREGTQDLADWALTGLHEHAALTRYEKQLGTTSATLQRFYAQKFGWNPQLAGRVAKQALITAVSDGLRFTGHPPFASPQERQLRAAILGRQSLEQLEAIEATPAMRNAALDIATQHPPALRWLIARGGDPNFSNRSGKTPLMYAAQYNLLGAAQLLLEKGADPNAATTSPSDRCSHSLRTARITPLHYAVRYASAELVELLLRNGAVPYARAEVEAGAEATYPLDWLHLYSAADAAERNPNINDADRARLAPLLRIPTDAERTELARELVVRAGSESAAGNAEAAYRALRAALQAQSSNLRALDELSPVALKSGHIGAALQAADAVIKSELGSDVKARAWSNIASACQQAGPGFKYEDAQYCTHSNIEPLLQAWQLQPSPARKNQLKEWFDGEALDTCTVRGVKKTTQKYYFGPQRIYVYHPTAQSIDAAKVRWEQTRPDPQDTGRSQRVTMSAQLLQRHELGDFAITVLEAKDVSAPVRIGTHVCARPDAVP